VGEEDRESVVGDDAREARDLGCDAGDLVGDDHAGAAAPTVDAARDAFVAELERVESFEAHGGSCSAAGQRGAHVQGQRFRRPLEGSGVSIA
jgi:hypothetical protein